MACSPTSFQKVTEAATSGLDDTWRMPPSGKSTIWAGPQPLVPTVGNRGIVIKMDRRSSPIGPSTLPAISARQWERAVARDFLTWRDGESGRSRLRLESVCAAVGTMLDRWLAWGRVSADAVARRLPTVLTDCDRLAFADADEAIAYLVLHLADRYGRATQALELLLAQGWLPIRRKRMAVLDVGGGPAPALYAAIDFYDDLATWAASLTEDIPLVRVTHAHVLDRGPAWDYALHHFSEFLLIARKTSPIELPASLPFRRYHDELGGFSVPAMHHAERARLQRAIQYEHDLDDEPISHGMAWQLAFQARTEAPSAYDLVILHNFLTNPTMTEELRAELTGLARSLTWGGVLLVLGAAGGDYPAIHASVTKLATSAGLRPLTDVSGRLEANPDPARRGLVATQVRTAVSGLGAAASPEVWDTMKRRLPRRARDIVDHDLPFSLPHFQVLAFRRVPARRLPPKPKPPLPNVGCRQVMSWLAGGSKSAPPITAPR
jgi:hypothetical protein